MTLNLNIDSKNMNQEEEKKPVELFRTVAPIGMHYFTLLMLGLSTWGLLWCAFGDGWGWHGQWFRLAIVAFVAWASGEALQISTNFPPLMAALITGIIARNVGFLDMSQFSEIDGFLRRIYPVIIMGKSSLSWDVDYMKKNWQLVASLGTLPWAVEVVTLATCMHLFLDYPWIWGFLLGAMSASVSCAIIMPTVQKIGSKSLTQNWQQLICTAGGTDTALSVGVFGVIHSYMMHDGNEIYGYIKASLALFLGVAVGVSWGSLAKFIPHSKDFFVAELRLLFVLIGGLFIFFLSGKYGWGGTGAVAVLACNSTAAKCWEKDGWELNKNPVSTAYRVMWSSLEPLVFAYTGTFFVIKASILHMMLVGAGILSICLTVRLTTAFLVCSNLTIRERLFVCCTWIPKCTVEAVLSPVAFDALMTRGHYDEIEIAHAQTFINITIEAILITTPIGFLLTKYLGPKLLRKKENKYDDESSI